ncbi:MAG: hypothetical protein HY547_05185 [Elusimicrobia bacterium]|nr:hypothetical protein [Elusimicrobiota bacterium]
MSRRVVCVLAGMVLAWGANHGHALLISTATIPDVFGPGAVVTRSFGAEWGVSTIDGDGETGYWPSLDIDSNGRPHVAYNDSGRGQLKYAYWNGASWVLETVDGSGSTGYTPSMDLDGSDYPHIVYSDDSNNYLRYAYKDASGWHLEIIDSSGHGAYWGSIKVASSGKVHVAYQDTTDLDLKYAQRGTGGTWSTETVDSTDDVGQFASLDLDSSDNCHIAYLDYTNYALKYAKMKKAVFSYGAASAIGSPVKEVGPGISLSSSWTWSIETVDTTGWSGWYAHLKVDGGDTVHIVHQDISSSAQNLRYAQKTSGSSSWSTGAIDSTNDVGEYASLALDADGNPHASYFDETEGKVKYAYWEGSSWHKETIDNSEDVIYGTSIALDADGNPLIAYHLDGGVESDLQLLRWSHAPKLYWTGETNYSSDGVDPDEGNAYTQFTFRVKYSDSDDDAPMSGYPKLHVVTGTGTVDISGSPYSMTLYSDNGSGTSYYEYSGWLPAGSDYSYYFEAYDVWGVEASGTPTSEKSGPTVLETFIPTGADEIFAYPNPVRGNSVTVRMNLAYYAPTIELKFYDLTGQTLKTVADEAISKSNAPVYEYTWDLRDDSGNGIASGVYIYYMRAVDQTSGEETKKVKKFAVLK